MLGEKREKGTLILLEVYTEWLNVKWKIPHFSSYKLLR
jgi:hypothetical protein